MAGTGWDAGFYGDVRMIREAAVRGAKALETIASHMPATDERLGAIEKVVKQWHDPYDHLDSSAAMSDISAILEKP